MRSRLVAAGFVLVLSGCGSGGPQWADYAEAQSDAVVGDVVVDAGVYRLTEATLDGGCAQLTVGDVTAYCLHHEANGWGYMSRAARSGETRFVEIRTDPVAREFVVWSSASPSGRSIDPIVAADIAILVWIMEPGEEPWGVQAIGPNGELGFVIPFVGLPGT